MKLLFVYFLLFCLGGQSFAQIDTLKSHQDSIKKFMLSSNQIIKIEHIEIKCANDYYVYNDFKDTLELSSFGLLGCACDEPKLFKSIQLDSSGQKEIFIIRNCKGRNEMHGGTYDISEKIKFHKLEVWNLDTKVLLFEFKDRYKNKFDIFRTDMQPTVQKGTCSYLCKIKVDNMGIIQLSNCHANSDCSFKPTEGKFQLIGQEYQMVKPTSSKVK